MREQENAINNSDLSELMRRRELVRQQGTGALRDRAAQDLMRQDWLTDRQDELVASGYSLLDAERTANQEASTLDATHILDIVAGGDPSSISGLQNRSVNRSIGSQWRTRVDSLDEALSSQHARGALKANLRLRPC